MDLWNPPRSLDNLSARFQPAPRRMQHRLTTAARNRLEGNNSLRKKSQRVGDRAVEPVRSSLNYVKQ